MSGKLCPEHDVRISKAYCEGRLAAKNGLLITSNPHPSHASAYTIWDLGHITWAEDPSGSIAPPNGDGIDCCGRGLPFGGGFVAIFASDEPSDEPNDEPCIDPIPRKKASARKKRQSA